jgi:carboxypeptidase family protein
VSDASGARVAGAEVRLINAQTGVERVTATTQEGSFVFEMLPPGEYGLQVSAPDMASLRRYGLQVEVGGAVELALALEVAGSRETVTVSGAAPVVETLPAAVSSVLDERAISELPLNGRRFSDLALLTPGVTQDPRSLTSATNGDLAFGGIRGFQTSFLVDGVDNNNAFFSQERGRYRAPYQFSNEVIQEFRVSSNTYGPELGRSGSAVINVVTRSGGWQFMRTLSCPFPPCVNPLARPVPGLGAINEFESAASSIYHGLTISVHRRMSSGLYLRLAYTWAQAFDDVQDALVAGSPSNVQNSYNPQADWGHSVTDQRHRLVASWVYELNPFDRSHESLQRLFNHWKLAGIVSTGSGRPVNATIAGDANRDDNTANDRLPGVLRNSYTGPNYASTDLRLSRRLFLREHWKLELLAESFNLFNRDNKRVVITDNGFTSSAGEFVLGDKTIGANHYPGYYTSNSSFLVPTSAYAPRQVQLAGKFIF